MGEKLVASGNAFNFSKIGSYDGSFREGEQGHLRIKLRTGLPSAVVSGLDRVCREKGVELTQKVYQPGSALHFRFRKGIGPLVIIAAACAAAIIIIALVIGWQLLKVAPLIVAGISVLYLVVIVAGLVLAVKVFKGGGT